MRLIGANGVIDQQYANEINSLNSMPWVDEGEAEQLVNLLLENINARAPLIDQAKLPKIEFSIRVGDVRARNYYNLSFAQGKPRVWRAETPAPSAILTVETTSKILRYSLASDWGGEALAIGYGCDIHIHDRETVK